MSVHLGDELWLRPDFRDWILDAGSGVSLDGRRDPLGIQAEAAFKHAEYRVENCLVVFDQIDAVLALKRSLLARIDHLESALNLSGIPAAGKPLQKLEALGIIRKGMLQQLIQIRNSVEHDGASPPSLERCKEYLDVMWYFLKVSVGYLRPPGDMRVIPPDNESARAFHFSYDIAYKPLAIRITGGVQPDALSSERMQDWWRISVTATPETRTIGGLETTSFIADVNDQASQLAFLRWAFESFL